MKVSIVQHDIAWEDGPATQARLRPLIGQAAAAGARLVVLTCWLPKETKEGVRAAAGAVPVPERLAV